MNSKLYFAVSKEITPLENKIQEINQKIKDKVSTDDDLKEKELCKIKLYEWNKMRNLLYYHT